MSASHSYRYLTALPLGNGKVFLSWRLLASDRPDTPFHVERRTSGRWERITESPILDSTNFLDSSLHPQMYAYRVSPSHGAPSEAVTVDAAAPASLSSLVIPLNPDDRVDSLVVGDLCNDRRMGFVVRSGRSGTIWFTAFRHDGVFLWEIDSRLPIQGGWDGQMHHVPFLCWDVNRDGRTEFLYHSYRGTYPKETYDEAVPGECLTAVDAETGARVWETPWPAVKPRVMMTVGHLQGPDRAAAVVVQDETYGDVRLTAIGGESGERLWTVDQARGAGHNLDIADIDGCGVQEIICGGICYNGDGSIRWEAEPFGHTDISKPAKIVPEREGLQIWYAVEGPPRELNGVYLVDKDGKTLFKEAFRHAHFGWIARHAPGVGGLHPHTAEDARSEYGANDMRETEHNPIFLPDGTHWLNLTEWQRKNLVPVHWDEGSQVVFIVRKETKRVVRLLESGEIEDLPEGELPEGVTYGRNLACVDVVGDFRENIVAIDREAHRLHVLVNPHVSKRRGYSPCDHWEYLHDRSQLGSGYYVYLSPPETVVN